MAFVDETLLPHYLSGCTEEQHVTNLLRLSEFGTQIGGNLFGSSGYRLGLAQKFLSLLLKSLWALDMISEPPHCPLDRIIIKQAAMSTGLNWTKMTKIDDYLRAIDALKVEAASRQLSLAEWELRCYDRRDPLRLDVARLTGSAG